MTGQSWTRSVIAGRLVGRFSILLGAGNTANLVLVGLLRLMADQLLAAPWVQAFSQSRELFIAD